jgi:hypothetical protein
MWNATEALKFTSEHCQQGEKEKTSLSKALTNIDNLLSKHQAKNSLTLRYQLESNKTEKIVLFDGKNYYEIFSSVVRIIYKFVRCTMQVKIQLFRILSKKFLLEMDWLLIVYVF